MSSRFSSELDVILAQEGPLAATFAKDGDKLEKCRIYLAPAERHLLVDGERLVLGSGPRENNSRPAIDDGAAGLQTLKQCGGTLPWCRTPMTQPILRCRQTR